MIKIAILTCNEIDPLACNDDHQIIPYLQDQGIEAVVKVWNSPNENWQDFDFLIIRSTWDYCENISEFNKFIKSDEIKNKIFNSPDIVLNNYNKSYLLELEKNHFEIIPTTISPLDESVIKSSFEKFNTTKLIAKPLVGAGASGITVLEEGSLSIPKSEQEMMIQPFQESIVSDGEVSLIFFNSRFSHGILKLPKEGDFRSQEEFGSKIVSFTPDKELEDYAREALLSMTKESLYARVDLLKNSEGHWRLIGEIELIEPALYLSFDQQSPERFAKAISKRVKG
ncbi:conserved hypothetical protein [Halobacteriovorax marinus SJ]|uniref:Prokaryotic glutathione synthetase ATP-binding domain-containing protein n=1 Tax=Halobacteriovorax marinus (strain ATCC BAA-682 / DSM 15412 / SJ) TaxID=862908 RepID=E1X4T6_HALMS|nr:hypothetical protein [Halobacteriovorax marinus]CBW27162.1 conserved hypothetical protein [Halobacteriovorax marinus SJ]